MFRLARKFMAKQLYKDEGLYFGYQSNIAMFLHDFCGVTDYVKRNALARDLISLIFDL